MPGFSALKKPMTCFDFAAERKAAVFASNAVRKNVVMQDKNSMFCRAPAKDYCFIDHRHLTVSTLAGGFGEKKWTAHYDLVKPFS